MQVKLESVLFKLSVITAILLVYTFWGYILEYYCIYHSIFKECWRASNMRRLTIFHKYMKECLAESVTENDAPANRCKYSNHLSLLSGIGRAWFDAALFVGAFCVYFSELCSFQFALDLWKRVPFLGLIKECAVSFVTDVLEIFFKMTRIKSWSCIESL